MRGCGDCCRSLLLSLFVKNLILVWSVSSVLVYCRNQRHTLQRRNPKLPLPPHPVARSALRPPQLPPQAPLPLLAKV